MAQRHTGPEEAAWLGLIRIDLLCLLLLLLEGVTEEANANTLPVCVSNYQRFSHNYTHRHKLNLCGRAEWKMLKGLKRKWSQRHCLTYIPIHTTMDVQTVYYMQGAVGNSSVQFLWGGWMTLTIRKEGQVAKMMGLQSPTDDAPLYTGVVYYSSRQSSVTDHTSHKTCSNIREAFELVI